MTVLCLVPLFRTRKGDQDTVDTMDFRETWSNSAVHGNSFSRCSCILCHKRVSADSEKRGITTCISTTSLSFLCPSDTWLSKMEKTTSYSETESRSLV